MHTTTVATHLLAILLAAEPAAKEAAADTVASARQGLARPITLRIDKQSLTTAVAQLRDLTKLNVVLDLTALQQVGINPDQPPVPVQVDHKDVKARTALRGMLDSYGLTFALMSNGAVVVTTEDRAAALLMGQHVSVHLDNVPLAAALKEASRTTGVNLVLDSRAAKEASAKVSLQVDDIRLDAAVRLLCEMAGLKPVRVGQALFVTTPKTAAEMRGDPDLMGPQPGPAGPVEISSGVISGSGSVRAIPVGQAILNTDW